jgi:membrane protease YdiL (CAAX protease family)
MFGFMQLPSPEAPTAPPERTPLVTSLLDTAIRFGLWGALLVGVAEPLRRQPLEQILPVLLIFGIIGAGYLLLSTDGVARALRVSGQSHPLLMALPPLLLLVPVIAANRASSAPVDLPDALAAFIFVFLPPALALINTPRLRASDAGVGLVAVAAPLTLALARGQALTPTDAALRLGAFALPVLLLALTNRAQKERLNFLLLCAALMLWYAVEFDALPDVILPPMQAANGGMYFKLAVLPIFLYTLALAGKFEGLGLRFGPTLKGAGSVALNTVLAAVIILPLALLTGFVVFNWTAPTPQDAALRFVTIYLAIALPEEILFRGMLLRYLNHTLGWKPIAVIALSALIFGASHLDNPPLVGLYFIFATIAGIFYARAFLSTRTVTAAATVHALVDWIWSVAFPR